MAQEKDPGGGSKLPHYPPLQEDENALRTCYSDESDMGHQIKRTPEEQHIEVLQQLTVTPVETNLTQDSENGQVEATISNTSEELVVIKAPDEFEDLKNHSEGLIGVDFLDLATGEPTTSPVGRSGAQELADGGIPVPPPLPVTVPQQTLINGFQCPLIGLQTFKTDFGLMYRMVCNAINLGYRFFDCASVNGNEREIGYAIKSKIRQGSVTRDELFICGKLPNTSNRPDLVQFAIRDSLENLGLEYLDLYLIHWPFSMKSNSQFDDTDYTQTWRALEEQVNNGRVRSIGVANFNGRQIMRLCKNAKFPVVTNQIECNPYLTQEHLSDYCRSKNVLITAYEPLGAPDRPWGGKPGEVQILKHPTLREMSEKYGKTASQILLRYQVQRGHVPLPKSSKVEELLEFINVFDFNLAQEDIDVIQGFNCNRRISQFISAVTHKDHPFVHDPW